MKIEVYYFKSHEYKQEGKTSTFLTIDIGSAYLHEKTPTIGEFHSDYVKVPFAYITDDRQQELINNRIYARLNDDTLNPLIIDEKQEFIRENKLHTSMSIGDIISYDGKDFWIVRDIGFEKIFE